MWRPEHWYVSYPDACVGCTNEVEDEWGKVCDLSCGKYTARVNFESGADAMHKADIDWLKEHLIGHQCKNIRGQDVTYTVLTSNWQDFIRDEEV